MRRNFYLLFLLFSIFTALQVHANTVTVKGTVKRSNGTPAPNIEVKIAVYLAGSAAPCSEQVVITNNEGRYSKELSCQGDIHGSRIAVKNCDGAILVQEKAIPSSKVVEANFIICVAPPPPPPACAAKFTADPVPPSSTVPAFSFKFNSGHSEVAGGDNIVERTWDFRDGSGLLVNRVDPLHAFPRPGTYEVCLTIKTVKGCQSRICRLIVVHPAPGPCVARFTFERLAPKKFRFNSKVSLAAPGDSVVERKWDFRDGTTSTEAMPVHEFTKAGNYEVCLAIKTAKGCESRFCVSVKVEEVAPPNPSPVQIVSLYPTPARENLKVVVGSRHNNVPATVAIVNSYAITQLSKQVTLVQGFNPFTFDVSTLPTGAYFIKVITQYGTISKSFFKH